eukprot:jgi/Phyca11/540977/estExt2_Genewise1Plus.C_PHYCAscaffold_50928
MALQTLFTASSTTSTSESAAQAQAVECVPLNIEASEEEQRQAMVTNLRLIFGHAEFRPGQLWAISRVLRRKDTLLVLPTGAGKSLCYQFPALFLPGITLVISPLISLMNDQYESLPAPLKARAVCLSGSSDSGSKAKHAAFVRDLLADKLSLIFLSPEKALGAGMQALLAMPRVRARLALVCVDEAHCISEWSHHFRPSYLRLAEVFRHAQCVLCVTATASRRVVHDVLHQLRSRQVEAKTSEDESDMVLQMPWQRRNLALEVRSVRSNDERLRHLVQALPELSKGPKGSGGGVIVYVHQQRQTEELSALLREQLPSTWRSSGKVLAFHAGMTPEAKEKVRKGFAKGRVRVVVATIAFGMGIDKKNDGYLSSWTIDLHLHETAHWYSRAVSSKGNGEEVSALLAHSSAQQEGETTAAAVAAASNERRMLQELRAAQQTGQIQRMTLSQPAFQVQLSWRVEVTEEIKAEAVDRWTGVLYAKHEHLESRQLKRLVMLLMQLRYQLQRRQTMKKKKILTRKHSPWRRSWFIISRTMWMRKTSRMETNY